MESFVRFECVRGWRVALHLILTQEGWISLKYWGIAVSHTSNEEQNNLPALWLPITTIQGISISAWALQRYKCHPRIRIRKSVTYPSECSCFSRWSKYFVCAGFMLDDDRGVGAFEKVELNSNDGSVGRRKVGRIKPTTYKEFPLDSVTMAGSKGEMNVIINWQVKSFSLSTKGGGCSFLLILWGQWNRLDRCTLVSRRQARSKTRSLDFGVRDECGF